MRKPRDFDSAFRARTDKTKALKENKRRQLGDGPLGGTQTLRRRAPRVFRAPSGNNPEPESAATRKKAGGRTAVNKIIGVADTSSNRQLRRELGGKPYPFFGRTVEVDAAPQLAKAPT